MSMIAECTIVINKNLSQQLEDIIKNDYNARKYSVYDCSPAKQFNNSDILLYIMDSNGCPMDVEEFVLSNNGIFEIDYLDGEGAYTQVGTPGGIIETDENICQILQLSDEDTMSLAYSC